MNPSLAQLPNLERPREKLIARGPATLSDTELLALLLRSGTPGHSVLDLARTIQKRYNIHALLDITFDQLASLKGVSEAKACTIIAAVEYMRRALNKHSTTIPTVKTARDALAHLSHIRTKRKEHFAALYLNARNQLLHKEIVSIGTLDANLVHPREVFQPAIMHNAARLFVAHNHPSGDPDPSAADIEITRRIDEAGKIMGVTLMDHLIITEQTYISMAQKRLF